MKWIHRFFNCLEKTYEEISGITFDMYVVYGDDIDGTSIILPKLLDGIQSKYGPKIIKKHITLPKRLDSIQKLSILRNSFIDNDLYNKYDYILIIDTDVMFEPFTIMRLIKDIENPALENPGVVAPKTVIENYHSYGNDYFYDTYAFKVQDKSFLHTRPYIPVKLFGKDRFKSLIKIDSVGSFYLAKTDIFTKYDVKYGTYLRKLDQNSLHPQRLFESEQIYFCEQVKIKSPYNIYIDMNATVYHINLPKYGIVWH